MKQTTGHANAKNIIKRYKDNTGYFDGSVTVADMYTMLRDRMQFGNAESQIIIAALTLAGAQWKPASSPAEEH